MPRGADTRYQVTVKLFFREAALIEVPREIVAATYLTELELGQGVELWVPLKSGMNRRERRRELEVSRSFFL